MVRHTSSLVLAVILGVTPAFAADPDNGERLAQARCVPCHIVEPDQPSQVADAPPFEVIARKVGRNRDTLAFSLLEPHPRMNLTLTRREAQTSRPIPARSQSRRTPPKSELAS